jgi:hypothetical protein
MKSTAKCVAVCWMCGACFCLLFGPKVCFFFQLFFPILFFTGLEQKCSSERQISTLHRGNIENGKSQATDLNQPISTLL